MKTGILTLQTIADASPKAAADFLDRLNAAVLDCKRSDSDRPRVVTLKLSIVPRPNDPDDVIISPQVGAKTPALQHESFFARASKNGQLKFDFAEPDEAD